MLLEKHQQLYHAFFESCIYQGSLKLKKDLQKQLYRTFLEFYINHE